MLDTLFEGYAFKMLFAFIVVFAVLALALWLVRRFGSDRLTHAGGRGRQPRLAVIDAANVDGRRKLVLIRRDNVEHLVMIGGPSDVVIEPNIVRAATAPREVAARPVPTSDTLPRAVPLGEENMWPLQPEPGPRGERAEPLPRPEPQALRPPPAVEPSAHWPPREPEMPAPPPQAPQAAPFRDRRARPDPLSGLAEELGRAAPVPEPAAPEPPVRLPPRREPRLRPAPAMVPPPVSMPAAEAKLAPPPDQNLTEMAQRLEAALRRPSRKEETAAPPLPPKIEKIETARDDVEEPGSAQASSPAPRALPPSEPAKSPREETKPVGTEAGGGSQASQKSLYDSLEQEMASLLGRPGGKI
jgi:flagellar protein FliO/FliZ